MSAEDVRSFVENNQFITGKKFFIGDLSLMYPEAIAILLKFVEETPNSVAAYASRDNIPPVIVSRFFHVVKTRQYKTGFDDFKAFVEKVPEGGISSELFLSISADSIGSFLLFNHLSPGVRDRIGDLI